MIFTTSDDIEINYNLSGSGSPIICIHGWTMCGDIFSPFHEELNHNTVISFDMRGHGQSGYRPDMEISYERLAKDIIELMQHLDLDTCTFLGWSFGVNVILENWMLLEGYARSLILLHGSPRFLAGNDYCDGMRVSIAERLKENLLEAYDTALMGFYKLVYYSEEIPENIKKELDSVFDLCKRTGRKDVNLKILELLYQSDAREFLENIHVHVQVIAGELDKICFPGASHYMFEKLPVSNLLIMPGGGHVSFFSKRNLSVPVVKKFMEEH